MTPKPHVRPPHDLHLTAYRRLLAHLRLLERDLDTAWANDDHAEGDRLLAHVDTTTAQMRRHLHKAALAIDLGEPS